MRLSECLRCGGFFGRVVLDFGIDFGDGVLITPGELWG